MYSRDSDRLRLTIDVVAAAGRSLSDADDGQSGRGGLTGWRFPRRKPG
jgi:hypothetical protein